MKIVSVALAAALVVIPAAAVPSSAQADDGRIAAGVFGGLIGGLILGNALAPRPYPPAPVYVAPAPHAYYEAPPRCYWTYGEPVWDQWRGVWLRPRAQVCD